MPENKVIKKSAMAPTVLISGGAGFVGVRLVRVFLDKGARVVVLDNFKTGSRQNVSEFLQNPKFALFECDINKGLPQQIQSVDYIFHLAGFEDYLYSKQELDLDALMTNALGTKNLLELATKSEAKFLLASSIDVYQGKMSQTKMSNYFGLTDVEEKKYSHTEAKRFAEAVAWEYYKKYETDVRIARLPEVYGPGMDPESSGSLGGFIQNLVDKRDIAIYGEGIEKEYYLYINDAASGLVKCLFTEGTNGKIYSLVPNESPTVLETAFLLKGLAHGLVDVKFKPSVKKERVEAHVPDTSNLHEIDWDIKVPFREGIIRTLEHFGYDPNEHSFKPYKLVAKKEEEFVEKQQHGQKESMMSLAEEVATPASEESGAEKSEEDKRAQFHLGGDFDHPSAFGMLVKKIRPRPGSKKVKSSKPPPRINLSLLLPLTVALAAIAVFIGLPVFQTVSGLKKARAGLEEFPMHLARLDSVRAQKSALSAYENLERAQNSFYRLSWMFKITGKSDEFVSYAKLLSSATHFSKAAYNISKASAPLESTWEAIRPTSTGVFDEVEYEKAINDFATAKSSFMLATADYKYVNSDYFPEKFEPYLTTYAGLLVKTEQALALSEGLISEIPALVGVDKPKRYLILFQNSNEIRPTGGFIGSYAVLELTRGKIENLVIDDIYNPDGQIDVKDIKVPPPVELADFLQEERLYLRNANYDPDFTRSAETIKMLYNKVTGDDLDGVIGIDLYFTQNLLEAVGPVFLAAYNEEVNAQNVYERTQYYSEFNYQEGSDQKKSFLTLLGSKILEKVFAMPKSDLPELLSALFTSLDEKHLLVYLPNSSAAGTLKANGWDGSLETTSDDFLYVVNSNLGGTKANYYVKPKYTYEVSAKTRDGLLRGVLALDYNHTGENDSWPGGAYTDYVRIITQSGSKLTGARIIYEDPNGIRLEDTILDNVKVSKVGNYDSFETSFVLEPKHKIKLVLTYDLPPGLSLSNDKKEYRLVWQKQPGTGADPIIFGFDAPFGMEIRGGQDGATGNGFVRLEEVLEKTKTFNVVLR